MGTQVDIPRDFHTDDPAALKRELDRLGSWLITYQAALTGQAHAGLVQPRLRSLPLNDTRLAFGYYTPISLSKETDVHRLSLPRPDPRNAGLICYVSRDSIEGTILISAPGCLINGASEAELSNAIAATPFVFIGGNYYAPPGAVWTG